MPVGIVGAKRAIYVQIERIGRTADRNSGAAKLRHRRRTLLEGHSDVEPAAAFREELFDGRLKTLERHILRGIYQRLTRLLREVGVYPGRSAVADGVPEYRITIHEKPLMPSRENADSRCKVLLPRSRVLASSCSPSAQQEEATSGWTRYGQHLIAVRTMCLGHKRG